MPWLLQPEMVMATAAAAVAAVADVWAAPPLVHWVACVVGVGWALAVGGGGAGVRSCRVGAGAGLEVVRVAGGWVGGGWVAVTALVLVAVALPWQVVGPPWGLSWVLCSCCCWW